MGDLPDAPRRLSLTPVATRVTRVVVRIDNRTATAIVPDLLSSRLAEGQNARLAARSTEPSIHADTETGDDEIAFARTPTTTMLIETEIP